MKRSIEVLLTALVTGLIAFQLGSCGRETPQDVRQDAYEAERILRRNRNTLVAQQAKTDTITRTVILTDARLREQRDSLMSVLTYADSVLADSTATLLDLRVTLGVTVARVRTYRAEVDSLQAYTRELIAAHALERFAANQALSAADSAVNAWKRHADAERRKKNGIAVCAAGGAGAGAWAGTTLGGPAGALVGTLVGGFTGWATCK